MIARSAGEMRYSWLRMDRLPGRSFGSGAGGLAGGVIGEPAKVPSPAAAGETEPAEPEADAGEEAVQAGLEGEEGRRRRRRGGRGRGRGRGRGEGVFDATEGLAEAGSVEDVIEAIPAPRAARPAAFGSVWDSQIGVSTAPGPLRELPPADEFDDEPAIPEYLIAERRGSSRSGQRPVGGRGVRAGYSAAVDRERYGRGGSSGGINRYPDVSARTGVGRDGRGGRDSGRRDERSYGRPQERPERGDRTGGAPRPGEGWSEVPPELEAMLRAQLAASGAAGPGGRRESGDRAGGTGGTRRRGGPSVAAPGRAEGAPLTSDAPLIAAEPPSAEAPGEGVPTAHAPRRRTTRSQSSAGAPATAPAETIASAGGTDVRQSGTGTTRRRTTRTTSPATTETPAEVPAPGSAPARVARPRAARPKGAATANGGAGATSDPAPAARPGDAPASVGADGAPAAPKRRATRTKAASDNA